MDLNQLVKELNELPVLKLAELKTKLEEEWGVTAAAAAPTVVAAAPAEAAAAEESTDFAVILQETGGNKIAVIKAVREVTGLGLKEAKELVEGAPKPVKDSAPKAEAEEAKGKLEAAGAKVELKGL